ncbi:MAG: molecular chaperone HtpG [Caldilineaceae bacterium]
MTTTSESTTPETMEYRTEVKQLLNILAHSLYTDREIFLRELISNASDALNRIQFEMLTNPDVVDSQAELAIKIDVDPDAKTITINDSGIGMNHDELVQNLGTIAHSGAKTFMQNAGNNGKANLEEIIGQFGVGFYSVFTVADEVEVTSRSYRPEDSAWTWRSTGDSQFTITPAEKSERGTSILIKLKEDASEFGTSWRVENIIKKHSDYVSFPIYVKDVKNAEAEPKIANRRTAIWRQSPSKTEAKEYEEFYKQLTFDDAAPMAHIHFVTDAPVNIRSLLFIPSKRERRLMYANADFGLRLYSRKILIQQRNKDLLPEYLRFIEGVVDSEDLPLNVSREMVQSNPVLRRMKTALTGRVHKELKTLSEGEADKYTKFWEELGVFIKEGVTTDFASQAELVDLLRFRSSHTGEDRWTSLKQYSEKMSGDQNKIYYVLANDLKSAARSPHLDYFRANDIEVLYLVDPIDSFMVGSLREYSGKQLQNVDDSNLELPKDKVESQKAAEVPQEEYDKLQKRVTDVLGDRIKSVRESKQLVNSPCRLVSDDAFERDMERIRRITGEEGETSKRVLELNRSHPIVASLAHKIESGSDTELVNATIEQLFDNALLLEGLHQNPADMVERIQKLMAAAVGKS